MPDNNKTIQQGNRGPIQPQALQSLGSIPITPAAYISDRPSNMIYPWDSTYDKGLTSSMNQRWNRADNQSGLGQIWNGVLSRGLSIGPKVVAGFAGVAGFVESLIDDSKGLEYAWENDMMKHMQEADEKLREIFPVYKSAAYDQSGLLGQMMTTSMWADDFLDGVAYAASAYGPGGAVKYLGKGLQMATQGTKMARLMSGSLGTRATIGISTGYNAISEAAVEAHETQKSIEAIYIQKGLSRQEAKLKAAEHAKNVFKVNVAALLIPNYIQSRFFHQDFSKVSKEIREAVIKGDVAKAAQKFGPAILKGVLSEGFFEENIQVATQQFERAIAKNAISDQSDMLTGIAKNMAYGVLDFTKGLLGYEQNEDEKERALSIFLGSVLGGGMGAVSTHRENMAMNTMQKLAQEEFKEITDKVFPAAVKLFQDDIKVIYETDGTPTAKVKIGEEEIDVRNVKLDPSGNPILDPESVANIVNRMLANNKMFSVAYQAGLTGVSEIDILNKEMALAAAAYTMYTNKRGFDLEQLGLILDKQIESSAEQLKALGIEEQFARNSARIKELITTLDNINKKNNPNPEKTDDFKFKGFLTKGEFYVETKLAAIDKMAALPSITTKTRDSLDIMRRDTEELKDKLLNKREELSKLYNDAQKQLDTTLEYLTLKDKPNRTKEEDDRLASLEYKTIEAQMMYGRYVLEGMGITEAPIGLNTSKLARTGFFVGIFNSINERIGKSFLKTIQLQNLLDEVRNKANENQSLALNDRDPNYRAKMLEMFKEGLMMARSLKTTDPTSQDSQAMDAFEAQLQAFNTELEDAERAIENEIVTYETDLLNLRNDFGSSSGLSETELEALIAEAENKRVENLNFKGQLQGISEITTQIKEQSSKQDARESAVENARRTGDAVKLYEAMQDYFYDAYIKDDVEETIARFSSLSPAEKEELDDEQSIQSLMSKLRTTILGTDRPDIKADAQAKLDFLETVILAQIIKNNQNKQKAQRVINQKITTPLFMFISANQALLNNAGLRTSIAELLIKATIPSLSGSGIEYSFDALMSIVDEAYRNLNAADKLTLKAALDTFINEEINKLKIRDDGTSLNTATDWVLKTALENKAVTEAPLDYIVDILAGQLNVTNTLGSGGRITYKGFDLNPKWSDIIAFIENGDIFSLENAASKNTNLSASEKATIQKVISAYHTITAANRIANLLTLDPRYTYQDIVRAKAAVIGSMALSASQNIVTTDTLLYLLSPDRVGGLNPAAKESYTRAMKVFGIAGSGKSLVVGKIVSEAYSTIVGGTVKDNIYTFAPTPEASKNINIGVYGTDQSRTLESYLALSDAKAARYKLVIVDEVLLLDGPTYDSVLEKAKNAGSKVVLMGDPSQMINVEKVGDTHIALGPQSKSASTTIPLTITYRTSVDSVSGFNSHYRTKMEVKHPVSTQVNEDYTTATETSTMSGVLMVDDIAEVLKKPSSRSRVVIVSSALERDPVKASLAAVGVTGVEVLTVKEMQGSQRDEVYVVVNNFMSFGQVAGAEAVDANRGFYTAITRAKSLLVVQGLSTTIRTSVIGSSVITVTQAAEVLQANKDYADAESAATSDVVGSFSTLSTSPIVPSRDPVRHFGEDPNPEEGVVEDVRDETVSEVADIPSDEDVSESFSRSNVTVSLNPSLSGLSLVVGNPTNYHLTPTTNAAGEKVNALKDYAGGKIIAVTHNGSVLYLIVTKDHNIERLNGKYVVIGSLSPDNIQNIQGLGGDLNPKTSIPYTPSFITGGIADGVVNSAAVQDVSVTAYKPLGSTFSTTPRDTAVKGTDVIEEALINFYDTFFKDNPAAEEWVITDPTTGQRRVDWTKLNQTGKTGVELFIPTKIQAEQIMRSEGINVFPGLPYIRINNPKFKNSARATAKNFYIPMQPRQMTTSDSDAAAIMRYRESVINLENALGSKLGSEEFYLAVKTYLDKAYVVKNGKLEKVPVPTTEVDPTLQSLFDDVIEQIVGVKPYSYKFATEQGALDFLEKAKADGRLQTKTRPDGTEIQEFDTGNGKVELDENTIQKEGNFFRINATVRGSVVPLSSHVPTIGAGPVQAAYNRIARANFKINDRIIRKSRSVAGDTKVIVGSNLLPVITRDSKGTVENKQYIYWDLFWNDPAMADVITTPAYTGMNKTTTKVGGVIDYFADKGRSDMFPSFSSFVNAEHGGNYRTAIVQLLAKYSTVPITSEHLNELVQAIEAGKVRLPLSLKDVNSKGTLDSGTPTPTYELSNTTTRRNLASTLSSSFEGVSPTQVDVTLTSIAVKPPGPPKPKTPKTIGDVLDMMEGLAPIKSLGIQTLFNVIRNVKFIRKIKFNVVNVGATIPGISRIGKGQSVAVYTNSTDETQVYTTLDVTEDSLKDNTVFSVILHEIIHAAVNRSIERVKNNNPAVTAAEKLFSQRLSLLFDRFKKGFLNSQKITREKVASLQRKALRENDKKIKEYKAELEVLLQEFSSLFEDPEARAETLVIDERVSFLRREIVRLSSKENKDSIKRAIESTYGVDPDFKNESESTVIDRLLKRLFQDTPSKPDEKEFIANLTKPEFRREANKVSLFTGKPGEFSFVRQFIKLISDLFRSFLPKRMKASDYTVLQGLEDAFSELMNARDIEDNLNNIDINSITLDEANEELNAAETEVNTKPVHTPNPVVDAAKVIANAESLIEKYIEDNKAELDLDAVEILTEDGYINLPLTGDVLTGAWSFTDRYRNLPEEQKVEFLLGVVEVLNLDNSASYAYYNPVESIVSVAAGSIFVSSNINEAVQDKFGYPITGTVLNVGKNNIATSLIHMQLMSPFKSELKAMLKLYSDYITTTSSLELISNIYDKVLSKEDKEAIRANLRVGDQVSSLEVISMLNDYMLQSAAIANEYTELNGRSNLTKEEKERKDILGDIISALDPIQTTIEVLSEMSRPGSDAKIKEIIQTNIDRAPHLYITAKKEVLKEIYNNSRSYYNQDNTEVLGVNDPALYEDGQLVLSDIELQKMLRDKFKMLATKGTEERKEVEDRIQEIKDALKDTTGMSVKEATKLAKELDDLNMKLVVYDSLFEKDPVTKKEVLTYIFEDTFTSNVPTTYEELDDYLQSLLETDITDTDYELELESAAGINEHIRLYNRSAELTLSGNIKAAITNILMSHNEGRYVPTSVVYYKMMQLVLELDWTKGLQDTPENGHRGINKQLADLARNNSLMSDIDKNVIKRLQDLVDIASTDLTIAVLGEDFKTTNLFPSDLNMRLDQLNLFVVRSENSVGEKLFHVVNLTGFTETEIQDLKLRNGSFAEFKLLESYKREVTVEENGKLVTKIEYPYRGRIHISKGFKTIKEETFTDENGVQSSSGVEAYLNQLYNKGLANRKAQEEGKRKLPSKNSLPRRISTREINFLVRRSVAQDTIRDIMQGMASMRKAELYIAQHDSDGGYRMRFMAAKAAGIATAFERDIEQSLSDLIAIDGLVSQARGFIATSASLLRSNSVSDKAKYIREFYATMFKLPATFTARTNAQSIQGNIEKIKAFLDHVTNLKKISATTLGTEGDSRDYAELEIDDLQGYVKSFADMLAADSDFQRNPSVRSLNGDRYYTIHESSHLFDIATRLARHRSTSTDVALPELQQIPYFAFNPFIQGSKGYRITQIGEFEGTKNQSTGAVVTNLRQNKNKFHESRIIAGFLEGLRATNGTQYYQFAYPFDKPKGVVFKVDVQNTEKIKDSIRQAIKQANYAALNDNQSLTGDNAKVPGFELLVKAKKNLMAKSFSVKEFENTTGIPEDPKIIDAMVDEVLAIMDAETEKLLDDVLAPGVELRFDNRLLNVLGKDNVMALMDEKDLNSPAPNNRASSIRSLYETYKDMGGNVVFNASNFASEDNAKLKELLLPIFKVYMRNSAVNSFFINQAILGKLYRFKNTEDIIKRYSSAAGPRIKPLVDPVIGSAKTYSALVLEDTLITKESLLDIIYNLVPNLTEDDKVKLAANFNKNSYEITDGQTYMTLARRANLARGYGSSWNLGEIHKPLVYGVDNNGNPVLVKSSAVSPSHTALNSPLRYYLIKSGIEVSAYNQDLLDKSILDLVLQRISKLDIGELLFSSAVKLNPLSTNAAVTKYSFADLLNDNTWSTIEKQHAADLQSLKEGRPTKLPILYNLSNSDYGFQFVASDEAVKKVSVPSQLMYFINAFAESDAQATRVYDIMSDLIELGLEDFNQLLNTDRKTRNYIETKLSGQGNEMALKLLLSGVPIAHPGIQDKAIVSIAAGFEKYSIKTRFKGGKVVLQSSEGVHYYDPGEDILDSSGNLIKDRKRDLKYQNKEMFINGKMRTVLVAEAVVPRELLTNEELAAVERGEDIFIADALGFRLPSTEIHSAIALKVVGVTDAVGSNTIIVPNIIVPLHGSDFDVDALYILSRETFEKTPVAYISATQLEAMHTAKVNFYQMLDVLKKDNRELYEQIVEQLNAKIHVKEKIAADNTELTEEEMLDVEADFLSYISLPRWSPVAKAEVVRKDIPKFNELKARKEWAAWNGYSYTNGKWVKQSAYLQELRAINKILGPLNERLKDSKGVLNSVVQQYQEAMEQLSTVVGESSESFVGYSKNQTGVYEFDYGMYERVKADYLQYKAFLDAIDPDNFKLRDTARAQFKIIKSLYEKLGKNAIVENLLDVVTSPMAVGEESENKALRLRMVTPITNRPIEEALEELKKVGLDNDLGDLELWNPRNHYEIYNSLSSGAILTGAFANAVKVFAYLNKASSRELDLLLKELETKIEEFKLDQSTLLKADRTIDPKGTINVYWGQAESATSTRILSNLAPRRFVWEGREYGSVEHAYQSNKSGTFDQATYDAYSNIKDYYQGDIKPEPNTIFVFGSNPEGRHGMGAAKVAVDKFGAKYGQGEGLQGNSYALPTKDLRVKNNNSLKSIDENTIISSIKKLYKTAKQNPTKQFKVAYRNTTSTSLNGYTGLEMIEMFNQAGSIPSNIVFSKEWVDTGLIKSSFGYGKKIRGKGSVAEMKAADSLGLMKKLVVESFVQNPDSEATDKLLQYENFTHNTDELIDKAFLEGLKLAQRELLRTVQTAKADVGNVAEMKERAKAKKAEIKEFQKQINEKIRELAKTGERGTLIRDKYHVTVNGKKLDKLTLISRTDRNEDDTQLLNPDNISYYLTEVLDTLINSAIDNLKEQKLSKVNIVARTGNIVVAGLFMGMTLEHVTKLISIPIMSDYVGGVYDKFEVFYGKRKQAIMESLQMSAEDFNAVPAEVNIDELVTKAQNGEDFTAMEEISYLNFMKNLNTVGDDARYMAKFLEIIKSQSVTIEDLDAFDIEFRERVGKIRLAKTENGLIDIENSDYLIDVRKDFSFNIPALLTASPHLKAAYKVHLSILNKINSTFDLHSPEIRAELNNLIPSGTFSDMKGAEKGTILRKLLLHIIFTEKSLDKIASVQPKVVEVNKTKITLSKTKTFTTEMADKIKAIKAFYSNANIESLNQNGTTPYDNAFLKHLSTIKDDRGLLSLAFTSDTNLFPEDLNFIASDFFKLNQVEFNENNEVVTRTPISKYEITPLQEDLFTYAELVYGLKFNTNNFSMFMDMENQIEVGNFIVDKLKQFKEEGIPKHYKELLRLYFGVYYMDKAPFLPYKKLLNEGKPGSASVSNAEGESITVHYHKAINDPSKSAGLFLKQTNGKSVRLYMKISLPKGFNSGNTVYYTLLGRKSDSFLSLPNPEWSINQAISYDKPVIISHYIDSENQVIKSFDNWDIDPKVGQQVVVVDSGDFGRINAKVATVTKVESSKTNQFEKNYFYSTIENIQYSRAAATPEDLNPEAPADTTDTDVVGSFATVEGMKNSSNTTTGAANNITGYLKDKLVTDSAKITADPVSRDYSLNGVTLKSVSKVQNEFAQRDYKPAEEMAKAKADKIFKGLDKAVPIQIGNYRDPMNYDQYVEKLILVYARAAAIGEILHLVVHKELTGDVTVQSRIEAIANAKNVEDSAYQWMTQDFIRDMLKTRTSTNYFSDVATDAILTELMVGSEALGIGGRIDMLIDHGGNVVSLYDFKTGKSFGSAVASNILLKYGTATALNVMDTARNRAQLQLALYAFILKHENPDIKFREIKNIHIPSSQEIDSDSALNVVDLRPYLEMIELYLKDTKPALHARLASSKPELFDSTYYLAVDIDSIANRNQFSDPSLELKNAVNELQKLLLYDKSIADISKASTVGLKSKRAKRILELTEKIMKLRGQRGINYEAISTDISWMDSFLGSTSYSTHPYVQLYYKMLSEAKYEARKEYEGWVGQYRKLTERLIKDSGLGRNSLIGGIDRIALFKPLLYEDVTGEVTTRRLYTETDPQFATLSEAQKQWLTFVNKSIASVFIDADGKVAVANKVVTYNRKRGSATEVPITNLDLYNGKGGNIRQRPQQTREFKYYNGFFPKIGMDLYDVQQKHGLVSKEMGEFLFRKYFTFYNEIYFDAWMNQTEAIPMKYLDKGEIIDNELYSLNLEKAVDSFMKHHMFKDRLDNVYALAQGLKIYLRAKETLDDNIVLKNLINFFDKSIEMHLLGRKQTELSLTRRAPFITKGGRLKEFNAIKFIHSLKNFMTGATMWIKPITGTANFIFASMVNYKEAVKGSLGLKGSYTNFGVGDLVRGYSAAIGWQKDAMLGKQRENKLYLLMEKMGYLPDNYDHYVQPNELLTTRNRMFSTRTLTMFHTYPEEVIAASLFYAQLNSIKLADGSSVWDHYKEVKHTTAYGDSYTTIEWDGTVRGKTLEVNVEGQSFEKDLTELSIDEVNSIRFLYEKIHGGYRGDERTVAEYYIFGDLALQLRRFMPAMLKNAFASRGYRTTEGEYKDVKLEGKDVKMWTPAIVEGRWRMFAGMLINTTKLLPTTGIGGSRLKEFMDNNVDEYMGYRWDSLSDVQKRDMLDLAATFLAFGTMLMGYHTMWDADDEDPYKKFYQRIMNDFTLLANPVELLSNAVNLVYQPVAPSKWRKLIVSSFTLGQSLLLYGMGSDAAFTRQGNLRGFKEWVRHIPVLSAWRDVFKFYEELQQKDALQRYR